MSAKKFRIADLISIKGKLDLGLTLVAGAAGLDKVIKGSEINRPGLTLAGFYEFFAFDRIQIFGLGETALLHGLDDARKREVYEKLFSYDMLCCIFSHGERPDDIFLDFSEERGIPVLFTGLETTRLITLITHIIEEAYSPSITLHGTLVEVFGIGVLLTGKSGIGKSECALELIERGHRLVADDLVEVKRLDEYLLMGSGSEIIKHHMEIRGIGIINVRDIFGIRSVRNRKRIELVALLEEWQSGKEYDRLGIEEEVYTILDVDSPYITIPVRPGRNIPIIIETAALNRRLKKMGVFSASELDMRIQNWMKQEGAAHD